MPNHELAFKAPDLEVTLCQGMQDRPQGSVTHQEELWTQHIAAVVMAMISTTKG